MNDKQLFEKLIHWISKEYQPYVDEKYTQIEYTETSLTISIQNEDYSSSANYHIDIDNSTFYRTFWDAGTQERSSTNYNSLHEIIHSMNLLFGASSFKLPNELLK